MCGMRLAYALAMPGLLIVLFLTLAIVAVAFRDRWQKRQGRMQVLRREAQARVRLAEASLLVGGAAERPIVVQSPAEIEARATSFACVHCGRHVRFEEQTVGTFGGERLRLASVVCSSCGRRRTIYFRLQRPVAP